MTFDAYCRARRLGGAFEQLREGADLDSAAYDAGYESLSGFREAFSRHFGTPPGRGPHRASSSAWRGCARRWGRWSPGPPTRGCACSSSSDRRMLERQLSILGQRFKLPLVPGRQRAPAPDEGRAGPVLRRSAPGVHGAPQGRWAPTSSSASGRRCSASPTARPGPTSSWRRPSARPTQSGRWDRPTA